MSSSVIIFMLLEIDRIPLTSQCLLTRNLIHSNVANSGAHKVIQSNIEAYQVCYGLMAAVNRCENHVSHTTMFLEKIPFCLDTAVQASCLPHDLPI